jgi:hypothetical protein
MLLGLPVAATGGIHPSTWDGLIKWQIWYNRALTNRDYAAIEQTRSATYVRRRRPAIYGDSRSVPAAWPTNLFGGITVPNYWMSPVSNAQAGWNSYAVSGYTCTDVLAQLTSQGIYTKYLPGRPFAHLVCCGVNDPYVDGIDGATLLARYWAIHDALASNNPNDYRVAFTIPQRDDSGTYPVSQVSAAIDYANDGIREEWSQHCQRLVDVVASSAKWLDPQSDYYDGSGVHFSALGNAAYASAVPITDIMNAAALRASSIWLAS